MHKICTKCRTCPHRVVENSAWTLSCECGEENWIIVVTHQDGTVEPYLQWLLRQTT